VAPPAARHGFPVSHEVPQHQALRRRRLTDLIPDLQHPDNPVPLLKEQIENHMEPHAQGGGG